MADMTETRKTLAARWIVLMAALCSSLAWPAGTLALSVDPDFSFTLTIDPPQPKVGDTVRLTFGVALNSGRGGLPAYTLVASSPHLEGDENPEPEGGSFPDTVTFERRAVAAGLAQVQLGVNYEAGVEDQYGDCCIWFFTHAQSPVFEFTIDEADDQKPVLEASCEGDCDADGIVRVDELARLVGIALGRLDGDDCSSLPENVTVDVLVAAVDAALHGCSSEAPTARPTATATPTLIHPTPPTATPTLGIDLTVQSCDDCCNHCSSEACFRDCFGVQACHLITEWEGTVTDEETDEPIEGAEVVVNGRTVTTDATGFYSTTSVRGEVCSGLDYLYEISVRADGYRDFNRSMYQSLSPGVRRQDITLAKP